MKKVYITGVSGTGKTTIAEELEKRDISVVSIDDVPGLCVWRNKKDATTLGYDVELTDTLIAEHDWVCDVEKLLSLMSMADEVVVVIGSASNQDEYIDMFDTILLLQCDPDIFIQRIVDRDGNTFGKDISAQESILGWYEKFERKLLAQGAISIDVSKSLSKVVNEVMKYVQL